MKPYETNKKRAGRKRFIIFIVLLVLAAALAAGAFAFKSRRSNQSSENTEPSETINYTPATDEEKQQTEQHKQDLAKRQEAEQNEQATDNKKSVTPIITDASQYNDQVEVRAYIPDIVENGGTCTLTFKKESLQFTRTTSAIPGPQTTQCDTVNVPVSEFPSKGTWALTVSYSSTSSNGTSEPQNVEVN